MCSGWSSVNGDLFGLNQEVDGTIATHRKNKKNCNYYLKRHRFFPNKLRQSITLSGPEVDRKTVLRRHYVGFEADVVCEFHRRRS